MEQVCIQLANQANLLEVHSDRLVRLEQSDSLQRVERGIGTVDRAACILFEEMFADRRKIFGL